MSAWTGLVMCALLAAAPPLTDSQRVAVEDVADRSANIDETGLYALLDNAATWPSRIDAVLPGARLPDVQLMREQPGAVRGELFVIDGVLEAIAAPTVYVPSRVLSEPGWEDVEAWHIRMADGTLAIVCLTDPPDVAGEGVNGQRVPTIENLTVRAPGRFFKLLNTPGQDDNWRTYSVFVGHTARITGGAAPAAAKEGDGFSPLPYAVLFVGVVLLVLLFGYVRAKAKQPSRLAERLERRSTDEDYEVRTDLPEDPVAALETLDREHDLPTHDEEDTPPHGDRQGPSA